MTRIRARAAVLLAAGVATAALLAGCGSDDAAPASASDTVSETGAATSEATSEPTVDPSEPTAPAAAPACADVWVSGARIPRGYQGCLEGDTLVKSDKLGCSSGQALIRYADMFYGVAGGTIYQGTSPLLDDPDYTTKVENCRA